ncbi:MAG TPA: glycoside hydrolase family 3 N-terminal domain-containing protein [Candidatus Udaeobacter sp.]|nr:glycoside hydrolase family 3 N-terminal domain-containing protein [Candidatus Udaeobacter sp.]
MRFRSPAHKLGVLLVLAIGLLASCTSQATAPVANSPTLRPGTPVPAATGSPAGMSLDQEIGAVMMVGFQGTLTDAVLADWRSRQFGGLLIVNLNHNAASAQSMTALIGAVRGSVQHRLIAATDQEGGGVCLAIATVPCVAMPVGQADTTRMAAQLRSVGFDLDLGPVSDVCSGPASIMWGRCYGTDPAGVATSVGSVVDGIHAAGMLSAAKHFPGHGDTSVSSETQLPRIDEALATIEARDWPPFEAAVSRQTDFILLGHLFYPAIDASRSADLSPNTVNFLRSGLRFHGAIISDDMEMGAITSSTPTADAAVEFLIAGGDMVMVAHDLSVADATFDAIKAAVQSGRLPRERLDDAVATLQRLPPSQ